MTKHKIIPNYRTAMVKYVVSFAIFGVIIPQDYT